MHNNNYELCIYTIAFGVHQTGYKFVIHLVDYLHTVNKTHQIVVPKYLSGAQASQCAFCFVCMHAVCGCVRACMCVCTVTYFNPVEHIFGELIRVDHIMDTNGITATSRCSQNML